jgi:outer membrane protein assembly factor BamB
MDADTSSSMRPILRRRLLACLLLALALAGCGGSGDTTEGEDVTVSAGNAGLVDWPFFGRVPERTHYLPAKAGLLDPPLKRDWQINTHALIEFPPAIHGGVAYVINKYGNAKAVRLRDRKVLWEVTNRASDKGVPNFVTAPIYYEGRVYGAFLGGEVVAGDAGDGHTVWRRKLPGHLESSPMAAEGTIYLGTDTTDVVALRASDGAPRWRTDLPAAIKASPSLHDGHLYVADYESSMYGLNATTGQVIWRTNTSKVAPFGKGGFFSSPAIAYGRVYAARDDGTVFALDEKTGKVEWSFNTGGPVYGSPAVAAVPGTPPTVYIGAENGRFFALDASTGKPRWRYEVGGPVPGTATVIGHTVYTSSFKTNTTIGLDAVTHEKTFELKQAGYTPVVSDGRRLYLVGYYVLIALQPSGR